MKLTITDPKAYQPLSLSPRVLSIMRAGAGNGVYGNLLKEEFKQSSTCDINFYWSSDERPLTARALRGLMSLQVPNQWIGRQNLDFRRFRSEIGNAYMAKVLTQRKLKEDQYSVLHFHTEVLAFLNLDLMKKIPTVLNVDMTSFQSYQDKTDPKFKWTYYPSFWLGKRCFEKASKIVTWSEWARQSVINNYQIEEDKVVVIYPGVDLTKLTPSKKIQNQDTRKFTILFIGADFKRKGGPELLEVFLEYFSEIAELNLVTKNPINCQHPNVHIYHNIQPYTPEWLKLYSESDVFIMPTRADAFGYVFLEAMAMGLPIISTRINAIPEIIREEETGLLIELGNRKELASCIQTLMENPNLCSEMGLKARQIVEQKFNIQIHRQQLESIFRAF